MVVYHYLNTELFSDGQQMPINPFEPDDIRDGH